MICKASSSRAKASSTCPDQEGDMIVRPHFHPGGAESGRTAGRWADLPGARRALVQVDRVARHRPPAPASPIPVRLCRLRRTQTIEAEAVTPVGEVTTTDDTIMQPAPSP